MTRNTSASEAEKQMKTKRQQSFQEPEREEQNEVKGESFFNSPASRRWQ